MFYCVVRFQTDCWSRRWWRSKGKFASSTPSAAPTSPLLWRKKGLFTDLASPTITSWVSLPYPPSHYTLFQLYTVGVHLKFPMSLSARSYKFLSNKIRQKSKNFVPVYCSTFRFHMFILEAVGRRVRFRNLSRHTSSESAFNVTLYQQAKGVYSALQ